MGVTWGGTTRRRGVGLLTSGTAASAVLALLAAPGPWPLVVRSLTRGDPDPVDAG